MIGLREQTNHWQSLVVIKGVILYSAGICVKSSRVISEDVPQIVCWRTLVCVPRLPNQKKNADRDAITTLSRALCEKIRLEVIRHNFFG